VRKLKDKIKPILGLILKMFFRREFGLPRDCWKLSVREDFSL
jgi:hypothetical protein